MGRFRLAPLASLWMVLLLSSAWIEQTVGRSYYYDHYGGSKEKCDCQKWGSRKRIVGGQETEINQYPFIVYLHIEFRGASGNRGAASCGGSILTSKYVLTAAHCLINEEMPGGKAASITVFAGEHSRKEQCESKFTKKHQVETYTVHGGYRSTPYSTENDVAILKLYKPIEFNEAVGPICLPLNFHDPEFDGEKGMAVGWGQEGHYGPPSDVLEDIDMDIYSGDKCSRKFNWGSVNVCPNHICGYSQVGNVCRGDSGGPLVYVENGISYVVGVNSFVHSEVCDKEGFPGVFTRVTSFLPFIKKAVEEKLCSP